MAERFERMRKKRGTIRTSTTKLLTRIEEEVSKDVPNCEKLREMLSVLSTKEESLTDLDKGIEDETSIDDLEAEIASTQEYQDRILIWKARATRLIQKARESESVRVSDASSGSVRSSNKQTVKLPKLLIEKYGGEISQWQEFWSQYETAIHDSDALCKREKFTYLRSYLTGAAARAVAGLAITDSNYDAAVELLQNRFGRKDIVISAHMSKLLSLTPVKKSSDVVALRHLYDECEIQIRSLESLGVYSDTYGCLLCPVLLQLLPEDIALAYTRKSDSSGEWKVLELIQFLQNEVQSRERALQLTRPGITQKDFPPQNRSFNKPAPPFENKPKKWNVPSATALHTASNVPQTCVYCDSANHKPEHCPDNSVAARKEKLRKQGRCYVCLGQRHIAKFCRVKGVLCALCGRRHHQSVCDQSEAQPDADSGSTDAVVSSVSSIVKLKANVQNTVLLQTVKAWIEGPAGRKIIRCLLDGGSQRSFIHESVVKVLRLPVVRQETLHLHTFGSTSPITAQRNIVKVSLENVWHTQQRIEIEAVETPQVCTAVIKVPGEPIQEELKRKGLQLADFTLEGADDPELSVLIGADYYWRVVSGKVQRVTESLVAIESSFGWALQGPVTTASVTDATCMYISLDEDAQISKRLHAFWEVESLGIVNEKSQSPEETEALRSFEQTITHKDGRYQVELPWRPDRPDLPNNIRVAKGRFEGLKRRLKMNVTLYTRYNDVIQDYLQQGICEDAPENTSAAEQPEAVKYYMPHHAVLREDKITTKLRVVFDASSHEEGSPSLNDCLLTGPNLNPNLLDVLIKFRLHQIAFTADITKAFLQIALAEKDRDAVRFLWLHGPPSKNCESEPRIMRMSRVVFGVSPSPFLLAATIRKHIKQFETEQPRAVEALRDSLYVDDFISSSCDLEEAFSVTTTAKEILSLAGMKLCKWVTNSPDLRVKWTKSGVEHTKETDISGNVLKVLGLVWRSQKDEFVFDLKGLLDILKGKENTKRNVLQISARIFDPIGFLTPFTIRVKCLFQELWERGISWDEQLPPDLAEKWDQWCAELPRLHLVAIPRWYQIEIQPNSQVIKLHVFCDASEKAYSAVAYLQGQNKEGEVVTSFVASKSRVAPLKKMTLPRLELMGALIGARLGNNLLKPLNMERNQLNMWTDSMIVLHWIRSAAQRWKPFVANRVTEIQSLTNPELWSHCTGKANPADLPTRGQSVENLIQSQLWWSGPASLLLTDEAEIIDEDCVADEVNTELRSRFQTAVQLTSTEQAEPLLDLEKYSRLKTVLRITAWVKRFIANSHSSQKVQGELTSEELAAAETYWVKVTQEHSFRHELGQLKSGQTIKGDSKIKDLKPFLDENSLISVGGRLQHSDFSFREQHPWVLPTNHRYSELLVQYCHERVMHSGVRDTLVQVRERYWVLKGRQLVKRILSHCYICRKLKVKPAQQVTAPLPRDRVTESPPFEVTGVDFAGPLYVKASGQSKKAYIALFTCAVTRAVHLELVSDQTTENFLLALKRFIARRGLCRVIYSDNAKTFKRADQDLRELWQSIRGSELTSFFTDKGITWKFIVERAAWWGGFWERLVRSVKTCLKRVLGKASLNFEELTTILAEVEAVLNSRPLSYVNSDASEPQPLTPSHFLVGKRLTSLPPKTMIPPSQATNLSREDMGRRWRYRQRILTSFWNRWQRDYLMDLKSAHKCETPTPTVLKVGDVVLIGEDRMPRQTWKMGRITELFLGRDGLIRSCTVRISTGTLLKRPVQLIYPLEIS